MRCHTILTGGADRCEECKLIADQIRRKTENCGE
jgi:hypothetical protein